MLCLIGVHIYGGGKRQEASGSEQDVVHTFVRAWGQGQCIWPTVDVPNSVKTKQKRTYDLGSLRDRSASFVDTPAIQVRER